MERLRASAGSRPPLEVVLDALAVVGLVAVLALAPAAVLSASSVPSAAVAPTTDPLPPLQREPAGAELRSVPVFTAGSPVAAAAADRARDAASGSIAEALADQSVMALGPDAGPALLALVADWDHPLLDATAAFNVTYPYRFPRVDAILERSLGHGALASQTVDALNDLAGLLLLGAADNDEHLPNAGSAAFSVFDRARQDGACDPQLNLGFMLSTETVLQLDDTETELREAADRCGDDPTPLWLLGQVQSQHGGDALATFAELQERFPGSAVGWAGEADARLRTAYRTEIAQPFAARVEYRRAAALYERAAMLDDDPGIAAGEARAAAGLGANRAAIDAQQRALEAAPDALAFQVRLVDYLERDHRFAEAAELGAEQMSGAGSVLPGPGLISQDDARGDGLTVEDALGALSIGAERLRPVRLAFAQLPLPFTDGVVDISFIPRFRGEFGLTGSQGWCRDRARIRDLVLDDRAADALATFPPSFEDPRPGEDACGEGELLRPIVLFEAGDERGAVARYEAIVGGPIEGLDLGGGPGVGPGGLPPGSGGDEPTALGAIYEADQNLWRYAGDLERAVEIAQRWSDAEPDNPLGPDRAGEIAYLMGDFDPAAEHFADAGARASGAQVAHEQLKEGTAREQAGDLVRARSLLADADATATAAIPADAEDSTDLIDEEVQVALDSYNARVQAGDTELRDHEYAAAAEHYRAARERQPLLPAFGGALYAPLEQRGEPLFRPEVLENNESLVLVQLGHVKEALDAIRAAVAADPANPIFLANQGYVEQQAGDPDAAADSYRAALASDPTAFPAANNLGVVLAAQGRLTEAAEAFGQALAVHDDYAVARFNLGLVHLKMGAAHVLEGQGELAAATRHDSSLRDHDRAFITDGDTFFTTLDLSKPLPATWHFAASERRTPVTVAGVVLALVLFGLVRTYAQGWVTDTATAKSLRASSEGLSSRLARAGGRLSGGVAVLGIVAVLVYPLVRSSGTTTSDVVLLAAGIGALALASMRLRSAVARRDAVRARHHPSLPAIAVGAAAAAIGIGYAPMPATTSEEPLPRRARWISTGMLGGVAVVLLVVGRLSAVPIAAQLGGVSLVMTSSALIPVAPYDGAFLDDRRAALLVAAALALAGILIQLRVL